ncbi:MAG: DUF11 domain-containing protein [Planctomycetota bacterium]
MTKRGITGVVLGLAALAVVGMFGCKCHMPHALTWPATGDIIQTHPKPPEGGYYGDWDPYAAELEVVPLKDVNPVRTQHVLIATVKDKEGNPLMNRRVEWIISEGSVGDIVEVDESGWRASRGYKVDNHYAVSHTNTFDHVLDLGNDDPSDDIQLTRGQTWCVITSPIEGDTYITAYAPAIYDWAKHKVFVTKHWYDVAWEFPPEATNPIGTTHDFTTAVMKYSDGTPLADYIVTYKILDGPAASFEPGGDQVATVTTDENGLARVTLSQAQPAEGTNNVEIDIVRPEDVQCCKPAAHIATGYTAKTWIGPKIAITKDAPARELINRQFAYNIVVSNPSQVTADDVIVTDTLPDGIAYVSSVPSAQVSGQTMTWSLGSLAGQGSTSIAVQVQGTRTGTFENCAEVRAAHNLAARDCASTVIVAPALVLDKQCTPEVLICDPIDYTLTVRNTGDGPANNVVITDRLPAGLVTVDGRNTVTENLGTLEAGQSRQIAFQVKAQKTGRFENTAMATADGDLTAEAECVTVVLQPVLEVTKTGPDLRYIGRTVTYQITVANAGDGPARDTMLVDTIPSGVQFVEASDGGNYDNGRVTWSLGTLQPSASRSVSLTVKPSGRGVIHNTAVAKAYCAEDSAEVSTEIKGIPAILLEVIDVDDPIEVGSNETYIITVTNQGSADGTNIVIECTIPSEEEHISSNGPTNATVSGQNIKFAPLPTLAPLAKATYRVVVRGVSEGDVRFKVSLTSDQMTTPAEETESTHIYE